MSDARLYALEETVRRLDSQVLVLKRDINWLSALVFVVPGFLMAWGHYFG